MRISKKQNLYFNKVLLVTIISLLLISLYGCKTTMAVTPNIPLESNINFQLKGKIIYKWNKDYLPRLLVEDNSSESILIFKYKYDVKYGRDNMNEFAAMYNPLVTFGFPLGESSVVVTGKLEILKSKEVVKTYLATAALDKTTNIFSEGETFTAMRLKGLMAVRNNIEAQIYKDREDLIKL